MARATFDPSQRVITVDLLIKAADGTSSLLVPAVLDTGASFTVIASEILARLGYDPANPRLKRHRIITGSGIEFAPVMKVRSIKAIGQKVSNLEVLCHDMPASSGIEGLLGLNFLRFFDLTIRFTKGVIDLKKR